MGCPSGNGGKNLGEKITLVLWLVAVVALICGITAYNNLDKLRFFLKRAFQSAQSELDSWVEACEKISPGCGQKYFATKNFMKKSAFICEIIENVKEDTDEKLDIEESLLDFCIRYRELANMYNEKLKKPLYKQVAALLKFKPCPVIDFNANRRQVRPFDISTVLK